MASDFSVLLLYLLDHREGDEGRAALIVDRLADTRPVLGDEPQWQVTYETRDVTEAMRLCEADLNELDPDWVEILDFRALRSRRLPDVRVDRS